MALTELVGGFASRRDDSSVEPTMSVKRMVTVTVLATQQSPPIPVSPRWSRPRPEVSGPTGALVVTAPPAPDRCGRLGWVDPGGRSLGGPSPAPRSTDGDPPPPSVLRRCGPRGPAGSANYSHSPRNLSSLSTLVGGPDSGADGDRPVTGVIGRSPGHGQSAPGEPPGAGGREFGGPPSGRSSSWAWRRCWSSPS